MVPIPERLQPLRGPRADSPQRAHRQRVQQASTSAGGTISSPSGLASPEASLATNLVDAAPTVAISPSSPLIRARSRWAISAGPAELPPGAGDVQERLVHRQRLDQRRDIGEDRHHRPGRLA